MIDKREKLLEEMIFR